VSSEGDTERYKSSGCKCRETRRYLGKIQELRMRDREIQEKIGDPE
jgi:hypothetical protein